MLTSTTTEPTTDRTSGARRRGALLVVLGFLLALAAPAPSTAATERGGTPVTAERAAQIWWSFEPSPVCPASLEVVNLAARSQWSNAPGNGYMQLVRQRQAIDDNSNVIVTAGKTVTTKDTSFEGNRQRFRWNQFAPVTSAAQWGYWTRSVYVLKWMKDDFARDTVVAKRVYSTQWCQQAE